MISPANFHPVSLLPSSTLVVPLKLVTSSGILPTTHSTAPAIALKRGGMYPIFVIYVAGSALAVEYKLTSTHSYSSTSQLHTQRSLNMAKLLFILREEILHPSSLMENWMLLKEIHPR